jgi:hypothetical protein
MKRTAFKLGAVFGAITLLTGVLVSMASAHLGATASPSTTLGPDLRTVRVTDNSLDEVTFCFDENVDDTPIQDNFFHLQGYDEDKIATGNNSALDTDRRCVIVRFNNSEMDVNQYTIGVVEQNAVIDEPGNFNNPQNSATLQNTALGPGGQDGRTGGPDLVSTTDVSSTNDVLYTFDESLDEVQCNPDFFGWYSTQGEDAVDDDAPARGLSCDIEGSDDQVARIGFDPSNDVDDATRYFVDRDQVDPNVPDDSPPNAGIEDLGDDSSIGLMSPINSTGQTDDPDLSSVTRVDSNSYDYLFDEDLDDTCSSSLFHLYGEDDFQYTADDCDPQGSAGSIRTVRAHFNGGSDDNDTTSFSAFELPTAGVESCATQGETPNFECSTIGGAPVSGVTSGEAPGHTDAPDLHQAVFRNNFDEVVYHFDENVDEVTAEPFFDEYCLYDADVFTTTCGLDAIVSSNVVTVEFAPGEVQSFDVATVDTNPGFYSGGGAGAGISGAAEDFHSHDDDDNNQNPLASAGRGTFQTTTTTTTATTGTTTTGTTTTTTTGTGTTTTTTTGTGTTTTTTTRTGTTTTTTTSPDGPVTRRVATTLTIRGGFRRNFKGSVGSARKRCQTFREVTVKKVRRGRPNRVIGRDNSNRAGNWQLRRRARRGRFYAVVLRKVFTAGNGDTIICMRDKSPTIRRRRRR